MQNMRDSWDILGRQLERVHFDIAKQQARRWAEYDRQGLLTDCGRTELRELRRWIARQAG